MRPTPQDVHVDQILSNVSVLYKNVAYIGENVAPIVRSNFQSDKYYIFDKADMFRSTAKKRAPGTASDRHDFTLSTDTFFCEEISDATDLADEVRQNQDSVLNLETTKVNFITDKVLLKLEQDVAALCTTSSNWGSNYSTPSIKFNQYETSDPITVIEDAIEVVETGTGQKVNKMILSWDVWKVLKHHPMFLERMPTTTLRAATLELLKSIFNIPEILIGEALVNSAVEGRTASYGRVWTKDIWLGHVAAAPAKETPTALYTFVWPENGQIRGVRTWREEKTHSDVYEAFMRYQVKVVGSDLGYLLENVID